MQRKYAGDGFAAVSVSLDDSRDAKDRGLAEDFLRQKQATFLNLILQAEPEEWQTRLKIAGPPCVYVFGRDNQFVLKQSEDVDYTAIEKKVRQLLGK
jgi:hypothetical protein